MDAFELAALVTGERQRVAASSSDGRRYALQLDGRPIRTGLSCEKAVEEAITLTQAFFDRAGDRGWGLRAKMGMRGLTIGAWPSEAAPTAVPLSPEVVSAKRRYESHQTVRNGLALAHAFLQHP
jgi:hypothetical protein